MSRYIECNKHGEKFKPGTGCRLCEYDYKNCQSEKIIEDRIRNLLKEYEEALDFIFKRYAPASDQSLKGIAKHQGKSIATYGEAEQLIFTICDLRELLISK